MRMIWRLYRTARVVRELLRLGLFAEVRITRGARGLESRLFVNHHGIVSIMQPRAALGLCEAMRKMK